MLTQDASRADLDRRDHVCVCFRVWRKVLGIVPEGHHLRVCSGSAVCVESQPGRMVDCHNMCRCDGATELSPTLSAGIRAMHAYAQRRASGCARDAPDCARRSCSRHALRCRGQCLRPPPSPAARCLASPSESARAHHCHPGQRHLSLNDPRRAGR